MQLVTGNNQLFIRRKTVAAHKAVFFVGGFAFRILDEFVEKAAKIVVATGLTLKSSPIASS
ncbi:hypothetical protein QUA91_25960 [Microcoleus sp. F10-A1]